MTALLAISAYLAVGASIMGWFLYGAGHRDAVDYLPALAAWRVVALVWAVIILWLPAGLTWVCFHAAHRNGRRRRG